MRLSRGHNNQEAENYKVYKSNEPIADFFASDAFITRAAYKATTCRGQLIACAPASKGHALKICLKKQFRQQFVARITGKKICGQSDF
jgi:predicted RNA-binding Zn ribbon-like protein